MAAFNRRFLLQCQLFAMLGYWMLRRKRGETKRKHKCYNIPNFFTPINSECIVIGGGDLNSRVYDTIKPPNLGFYRNNPDNKTNSNGRFLARLCQSYNIYVLNNLTFKQKAFDGKLTFQKADRKSQNDFCVSNLAGLEKITQFKIHDLPLNFSDHCPISLSLDLNIKSKSEIVLASADILTQSCDVTPRRPIRIHRDKVNWEAFVNTASIELRNINTQI